MHTGYVLSNTTQSCKYWYDFGEKLNIVTDTAPSVNSPTWTLEKNGDSYKMYFVDENGAKKYLEVFTMNIDVRAAGATDQYSMLSIDNTEEGFVIYVTGKDYYLTTYKKLSDSTLTCTGANSSFAGATADGEAWWQFYKVVEKGTGSVGNTQPSTPDTDVVAKDNDNDATPNFSFVFTTDIHIGNGSGALTNVEKMYQDIASLVESGVEVDTILISGDLTQEGYKDEYYTLLRSLNKYSVDGITTYTTMGNHDVRSFDYNSSTRTDEERWAEMWGNYTEFMYASTKLVLEVPYYHVEIAGHNGTVYDLVVLCTETPEKDNIKMSKTQLDWFEAKLEEIEKEKGTDQNILVMCHQPVPGTVSKSNCYDQYGSEVKSIIAEHPQVIYMSGHVHTGPQIYNQNAGTYLDGAATYSRTQYMFVEAYDGYFIVKVRDFSSGTWKSETRVDF